MEKQDKKPNAWWTYCDKVGIVFLYGGSRLLKHHEMWAFICLGVGVVCAVLFFYYKLKNE